MTLASSKPLHFQFSVSPAFQDVLFRATLLFLQGFLTVTGGARLGTPYLSTTPYSVEAGVMAGLLLLTLSILIFPLSFLHSCWYLGILTTTNTGLFTLLYTLNDGVAIPSLLPYVAMLLMAIQSMNLFLPLILSASVSIAYSGLLYERALFAEEHLTVIPFFLIIVLVHISKAHSEVKRLGEAENKVREEVLFDPLTGLPNRAPLWSASGAPFILSVRIPNSFLPSFLLIWMDLSR